MTRQKKELWKAIEQIRFGIEIDMQISCGCYRPDMFDDQYAEIRRLEEQLAALSHYHTVEEMYFDERGNPGYCLSNSDTSAGK